MSNYRGSCECGFRTRWRWRFDRHCARPCGLDLMYPPARRSLPSPVTPNPTEQQP